MAFDIFKAEADKVVVSAELNHDVEASVFQLVIAANSDVSERTLLETQDVSSVQCPVSNSFCASYLQLRVKDFLSKATARTSRSKIRLYTHTATSQVPWAGRRRSLR